MANNSEQFSAYVTHLRAAHREFNERLRHIEREWTTQVEQDSSRLISDLHQLRDDLAHHFQEEESGGLLEEAVARRPSVGPEADRLEREHPALLVQVDRLIGSLQGSYPPVRQTDGLKEEFHRFAEQLFRHEAAENQVLAESFGIDQE